MTEKIKKAYESYKKAQQKVDSMGDCDTLAPAAIRASESRAFSRLSKLVREQAPDDLDQFSKTLWALKEIKKMEIE